LHLLYGCQIVSLPHTDYSVEQQGILLQHFQSWWKKEYLTSLREVHCATGSNEQTIKTGEVVQIHDDMPRHQWKFGVIEELVKGNDGFIQSVTVHTATGRTKCPIARLYPLEILAVDNLLTG